MKNHVFKVLLCFFTLSTFMVQASQVLKPDFDTQGTTLKQTYDKAMAAYETFLREKEKQYPHIIRLRKRQALDDFEIFLYQPKIFNILLTLVHPISPRHQNPEIQKGERCWDIQGPFFKHLKIFCELLKIKLSFVPEEYTDITLQIIKDFLEKAPTWRFTEEEQKILNDDFLAHQQKEVVVAYPKILSPKLSRRR